MATKIVLNKKNSKDEFGILTIQSFKNNSKTKKSIGIKVSVEDFNNHFNKDFNSFNPKELRFKEINSKISEAIYNFENEIEPIKKTEKRVLINSNHNEIVEVKEKRLSFIEYFNSRMELKLTEGHKYSYLNVRRKLEKYLKHIGKSDLFFDEFDTDFITKFSNYCLTIKDPRNLTESGLRNYFKVLKSVYHDAHNSGFYFFKLNPFALIKNTKIKKNEKTPLSINQVKALMELENLDEKLKVARSMFYFSILSNGMRCSDVMFMRYGDFKDGRLSYKMMKTHSNLKIATGIKTMLVLAEILNEVDYYNKLKETSKFYKREVFGDTGFTLNEVENKLKAIKNNTIINNDPKYEVYKGYVVKTDEVEMKNYIDLKFEFTEMINNHFIDYMSEVINKKDPNEFVFLPFISKKSVEHFKDYKKGDLLSFELFQKYKNLRNIYNIRLYEITEIYNNQIPTNIKERFKYLIKLSSHVARNTFVYILLKENVDIFSISNALAHTEIKTTQNYIKSGIDIEASDNAGLVIQQVI
jgi:site-specific recombinase XerD